MTSVRRAVEADAAAIAELLDVLGYPAAEEQGRARLGRFERVAGAAVLVAERDGSRGGASLERCSRIAF